MKKLTSLLALSFLFTSLSLARGDFVYTFDGGVMPETFTTEGLRFNLVDRSSSFAATARDFHLRMWDGENKKADEGGTRFGSGIDAEVFTGGLLVVGQVNTTRNTNDRIGIFGRAQGNLGSYFASVSFDSQFEYGRFMVGKSFATGALPKYIRSLDIAPGPDSSYYIELEILDDPTWEIPEVTGRLFDQQGGQLLAQIGFMDTNIGGVAPYTSGQAGVYVETWTEGLLDASFDNISAVSLASPPMEMTWDNGGLDDKWRTAKNWSPDWSPDLDSVLTIDNGDTVTLDTVGQAVAEVFLNRGAVHVASSGTLAVTEAITVAADATLTVDGTLSAATGTVAGTLAGSGTINADPIVVTGTTSPGGSAIGTLTLGAGEMRLDPAATFNAQVSLAAVEPGQIGADQIVASGGSLMLGGALAVSGLGDRANADTWVEATPSVVLTVLDGEIGAGGHEFTAVTPVPDPDSPPHLGQGAFLRAVNYVKPNPDDAPDVISSVELDLFVALGGDADGDGKVWLSDWAALRANFGNTGISKTWTDGNFDPWDDDKVWLSDWAALRANFGNSNYTEGAAAAVPEPGTIVLLFSGVVALGWWRRHRTATVVRPTMSQARQVQAASRRCGSRMQWTLSARAIAAWRLTRPFSAFLRHVAPWSADWRANNGWQTTANRRRRRKRLAGACSDTSNRYYNRCFADTAQPVFQESRYDSPRSLIDCPCCRLHHARGGIRHGACGFKNDKPVQR